MEFESHKALWNKVKELEGYTIDNKEVYKTVWKMLKNWRSAMQDFINQTKTCKDSLESLLVRMQKIPDFAMLK